jgi:quercetin dioxygenase-like cupin family protein
MALTDTLMDGLDRYEIGPKLRDLRLQKQMGLVELSQHTGLSAALLSKLERSKMYPTLPTLLRISMVYSVGLEYFFKREEPPVTIVRSQDRMRFPEKTGHRKNSYHFESLDFPAKKKKLNAYLAEFSSLPVDDVKLHKHTGVEFIHVMEGKLGLYVRDGEKQLAKGDSAYLLANVPHGYRRIGRPVCRAVVVSVP